MTDPIFVTRLIASFLIGGVWVTCTTIATERYGAKIGGLVGGMPSVILVSLFFIALTQSPEIAAESAGILPISISFMGLFMIIYLFWPTENFWAALTAGILGWMIPSFAAALFHFGSFLVSILVFALVTLLLTFILRRKRVPSVTLTQPHYSPNE